MAGHRIWALMDRGARAAQRPQNSPTSEASTAHASEERRADQQMRPRGGKALDLRAFYGLPAPPPPLPPGVRKTVRAPCRPLATARSLPQRFEHLDQPLPGDVHPPHTQRLQGGADGFCYICYVATR